MRLLILLFFFAASCSNPPYKGREVCGADDFVIDSYQIREGKYCHLALEGQCMPCFDGSLLEPMEARIEEGDSLDLLYYHPTRKDLTSAISQAGQADGYRVRCGAIYLPDMGRHEIKGLTLSEAQEKLRKRFRSEIADSDVFLSFRDRPGQKIELIGLIEKNCVPVCGETRLFEVLASAKMSPAANLFKSYVVRGGEMLPVDLYKLVKEGDMSQNIAMRGGDKVYVADPSASPLMVLGEVNKQQVIDLPNGFMPLRQALAMAGGIPFTGDKRYIQIIRGSIACPKIYTLNWEHIVRLPTDSLLVIPGDIVYVAATPIARWDRFVNQILPTLVGFDLVSKGVKNVGITLP